MNKSFIKLMRPSTFSAAKSSDLKKDTQVMKEEFERVVDRKDAIIRSLAKDIEEAEEQYPISFHLYMSHYCVSACVGSTPLTFAIQISSCIEESFTKH